MALDRTRTITLDKGKLSADAAQAAASRLQAVTELAELADADLVIEAIVENLDAKQALYAALEALVGPDCLFATNTSSISARISASVMLVSAVPMV